jgi:hypothetical protein
MDKPYSKATVYNFSEQLAQSAALSDEPSWEAFYREVWPYMTTGHRIDGNNWWQKAGVDRVIFLPNNKLIFIDEKKLSGTYTHVLLETVSQYYGENDPRNKIGWTFDRSKQCDYVAYATPELNFCYLLPFELLQLTAEVNIEQWKTRRSEIGPWYPRISKSYGRNGKTWLTYNCAVPLEVLCDAMNEQMRRGFGVLPLPDPMKNGNHANGHHAPPDEAPQIELPF